MNTSIHSTVLSENLLVNSFPPNTAVISFNHPLTENMYVNVPSIDLKSKYERINKLFIPDNKKHTT